ncbi:MAG TPA: LacI family DNA-binding transcriptional regulator [Rhizobiaceae bacterium]|nr:LacI family DNA-binding transcriptional regulator [Rhizobiaceae bacterium]
MVSASTPPRISKIADAAGVSTATVSNALSGKGRVSAKTVELVRATAKELGYFASPAGRALRTGKSNVLGLVLPDISNPLFPQIAQAIGAAAGKAGYGVLIGDSRGDIHTQTETIRRLLERGVDGMVVVPRRGSRVTEVACPVAMIDTPSTPGNTVAADHWQGGQQITAHLAKLGHRKVALIANNPSSNVQNDRVGGMRSTPDLVTETIWTEKLRNRSMGLPRMLEQGFTAFATVSDLLALRVLTELQKIGVHVPEDVSVTGFDDLVWASVITPSLTTMRMNMTAIAEIAVEALADAINSGERRSLVQAATQRVPMSLVVRQSSAPPPENKPSEGEQAI